MDDPINWITIISLQQWLAHDAIDDGQHSEYIESDDDDVHFMLSIVD